MPEEKGNWNDTPNIYIAFLDIMGFRNRVNREKHEQVKEKLESIRPAISEIEAEAIVRLNLPTRTTGANNKYPSIFPVSFSDSIILFSSDDSLESLE